MKFLSICSGIEAASVAWEPLGWQAVGFAEIEPFPTAVLKHHYPETPNFGDMTAYETWRIEPETVDVLVGGTPCQAFSVAGRREGLADARGNLSLVFCDLADHFDPEWIVWENVPGVLSSKDNAFGCFLAGLCGASEPLIPNGRWGNAGLVSGPKRTVVWRILDAQFFGVAQRRRRVFVLAVRGSGNWRGAAALFPVGDGLHWNSPPSRETRSSVAALTANGVGTCGADDNQGQAGHLIGVSPAVTSKWAKGSGGPSGDECQNLIAHTLRGEGFDASEDGTGRGTPLVPCHMTGTGLWQEGFGTLRAREQDSHENLVAFSCKDHGADAGSIAPTLRSMSHNGSHANAGGQVAVAFGVSESPEVGHCLRSGASKADKHESTTYVAFAIQERAVSENLENGPQGKGYQEGIAYTLEARNNVQSVSASAVRRLTPRECERLQGFPDDYTRIPWSGKPAEDCPDGPRYKALGNSMAVPVMQWIGERIKLINRLHQ